MAIIQPVRLLVSDIDGTLVTTDKVLTSAAIAAVGRLAEAGIAFTVISSRPPRGMARVVEQLAVKLPFAAFNGAVQVAPDMSVLEAHRLASDPARAALAVLARLGASAWVFADGLWMLHDIHGPKVERERFTVGFDPTPVADFDAVIDRIDKLVGVSDDPALLGAAETEIRRQLSTDATIERSQPYYLDVTNPAGNKGSAVRALAERLGVPLENVAVIGDMSNDVAMFRVAGFSIVMGQSPPAVKAEADVETLSNADDGFAAAVERFILPRAPGAPGR